MDDPALKIPLEFRPSKKFYLAIASLSALALVAALGSTSLSIALPVGLLSSCSGQTHEISVLKKN
jgi:hypothetical protein